MRKHEDSSPVSVFVYMCLLVVVFERFGDSARVISNVSLLGMELGLDDCVGSLLLCNESLQNLDLKTTNLYYLPQILKARNPGAA